jgi:hypothetical protein
MPAVGNISAVKRVKGVRARTDALRLLKNEHREIEELFDSFKSLPSDNNKEQIAAAICERLKIHATLEREIFYPAARSALEDEDRDAVDEALVEHESADRLIAEIEAMTPGDPLFDARMTVLDEQIRHHFHEEEGEIFHPLRSSGLDLKTLGDQMRKRRRELTGEMEGVPVVHGPPRD